MPKSVKSVLKDSKNVTLQSVLEGVTINDRKWQCIVTILMEDPENTEKYSSYINSICEDGYRREVRTITRESMLTTLKRLTKRKPCNKEQAQNTTKSSGSAQKIRQCARVALEEGNTSRFLDAALIKWMIYEARLESLARNEAELEASRDRDREFLAMQQSADDSRGRKAKTETRTNSARKANSRLRKRGEEWKDRVYVDDAPTDGPNLYILLAGFCDPALPFELVKIGIPLYCIFKLENLQEDNDCKESTSSISENCAPIKSQSISASPCTKNSLKKFWKHFEGRELLNVAAIPLCPCYYLKNDRNDVYDSISCALYNVHEALQAHAAYLRSMRLLDVYDPRPQRQITRLYEIFMGFIPEEYVTIPVQLDALLCQVEENLRDDNEEMSPGLDDYQPEQTNGEDDEVDESSSSRSSSQTRIPRARPGTATSLSKPNESSLSLRRPELELILHGDTLRLNACRANDGESELDAIRSNACLRSGRNLPSFDVRMLEIPRIAEAWCQEDQNQVENYKVHLPGIFSCCEKEGMEKTLAKHLLNLLGLRKLLEVHIANCNSLKIASLDEYYCKNKEDGFFSDTNVSVDNIYRNDTCPHLKSDSSLRSTVKILNNQSFSKITNFNICKSNNEIRNSIKHGDITKQSLSAAPQRTRRFNKLIKQSTINTEIESDEGCECESQERQDRRPLRVRSAIQFLSTSDPNPRVSSLSASASSVDALGRVLRSFEQCSDLFGLINARESLGLLDTEARCPVAFEEFQDAEILAPDAFLQIVCDCFQEYGGLVARHFVPTDTILLLFADEPWQPNEIIERRVTCAVRTPVCLRDFCDYVLEEEQEWIECQSKSNTDSVLEICHGNILDKVDAKSDPPIFNDEDFVLPGSLKARDLELLKDSEACSGDTDELIKEDTDEKPGGKKEKGKEKKHVSPTTRTKKDRNKKRASVSKKIKEPIASPLSQEKDEPKRFDFIGYDLGERRRVQVTNLNRSFEACDGTRLRITRETWIPLIDKKQNTTCVQVSLPEYHGDGWSFWCHESDDKIPSLFHLRTSNGIIVAFSRLPKRLESTRPYELLFEIQISWPSGLIIKPEEYRDADYPFYILQYYTTKGPGCKNVKDETHRKYLHNGDIVKFFNDNSIIVLRPNGVIITIYNFDKEHGPSVSMQSQNNYEFENVELSRKNSFSYQQLSCESFESTSTEPQGFIRRYTVLEPDGHCYEILDGRVIREFDRLHVNVVENCHSDEKLMQRADGTVMLLNADGELIVHFPDGTRTQTGWTIEAEPVVCDWSEEEVSRYFTEKEPEGFVSILIRSRTEHPNYATLVRKDSVRELYMDKKSPCLKLGTQALGELFCEDDRMQVDLDDETVTIRRRGCQHCNCSSSLVSFHLVDSSTKASKDSKRLLTFRDNTSCFEVRRDNVCFVPVSLDSLYNESCEHREDFGEKVSRHRRTRMFAVNRNGTAYEYHHRSEREAFEELMDEDDESSLICRPIQRRRGMTYRLALHMPPKVLGESRDWIAEYKIPEPNLSSPARDPIISDEKFTQNYPRFLMARLFEGIGRCGENSLINMQKALMRYWREIATGGLEICDEDDDLLTCECEDTIERQMKDIALGKVKSIDWESYECGRQIMPEEDGEFPSKRCNVM